MTEMRVATFAFSQRMLEGAQRVQSHLTQLQVQQASGVISPDYGGLGASAGLVLDFQTEIAKSNAFKASAQTASNRIDTMYSTMSQISDTISSFKQTLASQSLNLDVTQLSQTATSARDQLVSLLNSQYDGRSLFGGARTDEAPVSLTDTTYDPTTITTAQTTYYNGDSTLASVRVSSSQIVTYGLAASNSGFEQALRVFASLANATSTNTDSTTITTAIDLLDTALDGVVDDQTMLSSASSTLKIAIDTQTTSADTANEMVSNYQDVDIGAVTAQVSTYEAQLQASYSALAKISNTSLLQYLK